MHYCWSPLLFPAVDRKEDENALVILNYGKYIEPDVIQQFEKETGITIKYEEYEKSGGNVYQI